MTKPSSQQPLKLVVLAAMILAPSACTALLGAEAPQEVTEAGASSAGPVVADARPDSPRDAPTGRGPGVDAADAGVGFDASGVALFLDPSYVSFPAPSSSGTPLPVTVTAMNAGTAPSPALSATLVGATAGFQITHSTCGSPLFGDASCTVELQAQPTAAGQTSVLRVGGEGVYAYASLQGPGPTSTLSFEPPECEFFVSNGGAAATCSLALVNTGSVPLPAPSFHFLPLSSGFQFQFPPPCGPLAPGSVCELTLVYDSVQPGASAQLIASAGGANASAYLIAVDGGGADAGPDGPAVGADAETAGDASMAREGNLIKGTGWRVWGITSSDEIIASGPTGPLVSQAITGPSTPGILSTLAPAVVTIAGRSVFAWASSTASALTLLNDTGLSSASTTSLPPFGASFGPYSYFVESSGSTANLVAVAGTTKTTLSSIALPTSAADPCSPRSQVTGGLLYIGACVGGTGLFDETVWSLDAMGDVRTIATAVSANWSADAMGDRVFVVTADGQGQVLDETGALIATLDTGVTQGAMLPSGNEAVYVASGALRSNAIPPVAPVTLAATAAGIWSVSPSGAWVLYYDTALTAGSGDILVASTSTSAAVLLVTAAQTATPIAFTTDETALAWSDSSNSTPGEVSVTIVPTSGGSPITPAVNMSASGLPRPAYGSRFVYDLVTSTAAAPDLSASGTLLQAQTNPGFGITSDLHHVAFATSSMAAPQGPGVYLMPLP